MRQKNMCSFSNSLFSLQWYIFIIYRTQWLTIWLTNYLPSAFCNVSICIFFSCVLWLCFFNKVLPTSLSLMLLQGFFGVLTLQSASRLYKPYLTTAYYCLLLPTTAYYCLILPATVYYCLLLPKTACHCLLPPKTAYYCLREPIKNVLAEFVR